MVHVNMAAICKLQLIALKSKKYNKLGVPAEYLSKDNDVIKVWCKEEEFIASFKVRINVRS